MYTTIYQELPPFGTLAVPKLCQMQTGLVVRLLALGTLEIKRY
jgi:hypothetical protein